MDQYILPCKPVGVVSGMCRPFGPSCSLIIFFVRDSVAPYLGSVQRIALNSCNKAGKLKAWGWGEDAKKTTKNTLLVGKGTSSRGGIHIKRNRSCLFSPCGAFCLGLSRGTYSNLQFQLVVEP